MGKVLYRRTSGEVPQYYVHGNHEAIIPPATFDLVQQEIERRANNGRISGCYLFSGMIRCGQCGSWYGSKVWHSNSKYRRVVWRCNHKYDGGTFCTTTHLTDEGIQQHFLSAVNQLIADKEHVLNILGTTLMETLSTDALEEEKIRLSYEAMKLTEEVETGITQNARVALDQVEYQTHYLEQARRYDEVKEQLDRVLAQLDTLRKRRADIQAFMSTLESKTQMFDKFDEDMWSALVEYMTVQMDGSVVVRFKNGQEVRSECKTKK